MKNYGLMADLHFHLWNQFSEMLADGMNSRLAGLLAEMKRCGAVVMASGGNTIYVAGDVFHVRGSVSPLVLNPVLDAFRELTAAGIRVIVIPGNHDLAGKNTTRLSSAVTALEGAGVEVCNEPKVYGTDKDGFVAVVPWFESLDELKKEIETLAGIYNDRERANIDLLLHAPVNGVIAGLPDHGLDPGYLAALGFRRVLSGHYHNHKDFGNGVYSIGALAHHTFSDIGSKAGFLVVGDDVRWMASHLPEFQDLDELVKIDPESIPLLVDGNYVRVKTELTKHSEIEQIKSELLAHGARAVIVNSIRKPEARRTGAIASTVSAGASLAVSISEYVKAQDFPNSAKVELGCQRVLAEAGV